MSGSIVERTALGALGVLCLSMITPGFIRGVEARHSRVCHTNLRVIAGNLRAYASDYDGALPPTQVHIEGIGGGRYVSWSELLGVQHLACPLRTSGSFANYGLDPTARESSDTGPLPLVGDASVRFRPTDPARCEKWFRHPGGVGNVGWFDGHVSRECPGSPRLMAGAK